uniref:Uncharacterized protein n=1 Tax=Aegilops tauschii subsp. strangulata TaxID=200361 RepID=A0A453MMD6_AEGTS
MLKELNINVSDGSQWDVLPSFKEAGFNLWMQKMYAAASRASQEGTYPKGFIISLARLENFFVSQVNDVANVVCCNLYIHACLMSKIWQLHIRI